MDYWGGMNKILQFLSFWKRPYRATQGHTGPKLKLMFSEKGRKLKKYLFFRLVLNAHFVVFSENLNFGLQKFIIIICNSRWPAEVLSLYRPNCKPEVIGRWRGSRMGAWLTKLPSMVIIFVFSYLFFCVIFRKNWFLALISSFLNFWS